ncbi:MAG: hypothetical protein EBR19_05725, partial [Chitinophagaceae bacterium]|nr:hypothetical protein [Chitinophagaceae bacterium]
MLRSTTLAIRTLLVSAPFLFFSLTSCQHSVTGEEEETEYDGPDQAIRQELEMIRDPRTGQVPWHKLLEAKLAAEASKEAARQNRIEALAWEERGPTSDV